MAYEVTKLVHGRPYRYRVRSERDPLSGKVRNRWTYLGRGDADDRAAPIRPRRDARGALLDALDRLFARDDPNAVTAAAIATEAGLAHGTFYHYFRSKQAAISALIERIREEEPVHDSLATVPASRAEARAILRRWAEAFLRKPERHGALIRALYTLSSRDETILARRIERRKEFTDQFRTFLETLAERGFAQIDDPAGTAFAILAMTDGVFREAVQTAPLDDARIAAIVSAIERTVFAIL